MTSEQDPPPTEADLLEVAVDLDSLRRTNSGLIDGCIWLTINGAPFPCEGWFDWIIRALNRWLDDDANDGPMVAALDRLVGATVVAAQLTPPAWDLSLTFDNGLTLIVFAYGTPRRDADDYSLGTRSLTLIVGMGGRMRTEQRLLDVDFHDD